MIVKVQRALSGSSRLLIYDKPQMRGRTEYHEVYLEEDVPAPVVRQLLGKDLKGYFRAHVRAGNLEINDRVGDQPW